MSVSGVGSLIFLEDVTCGGSSRMNSVYKNKSADLRRKASNAFHLLKRRLKGLLPLLKQTTERGCVKGLEKHHKRRMQQFGDATKYSVLFTSIYLNTLCCNYFAHLKMGWSDTKGAMF